MIRYDLSAITALLVMSSSTNVRLEGNVHRGNHEVDKQKLHEALGELPSPEKPKKHEKSAGILFRRV